MAKQNQSYEQLWQEVLQNDRQAFEKIYKHFYPNLFSYARKLIRDENQAQDAIQSTFLYLWIHRQQIGVIQSVRFYLFKSIRSSCLKLIQKQKRLKTLEEVNDQLRLIQSPEELNLVDDSQKVKQQLKKALLDLSPRQQEIIYLKFYNNLDYEEIGDVLNINYQSVVNHVYRAIQKLREHKTLQFFRNF